MMFRRRIYAQAFTVAAMLGGSYYWKEDRQKRKLYETTVAERKAAERKDKWLRELEARDAEEKAFQERMRRIEGQKKERGRERGRERGNEREGKGVQTETESESGTGMGMGMGMNEEARWGAGAVSDNDGPSKVAPVVVDAGTNDSNIRRMARGRLAGSSNKSKHDTEKEGQSNGTADDVKQKAKNTATQAKSKIADMMDSKKARD